MSQVAPAAPGAVGFYGKIPAQRDFVRINAGALLRAGLDRWLQDGVGHLQRLQWPAEPTCFLLSPAAGTQSFVGALAPGTDALGRAFPVIIFAALDQAPRADFSLLPLQRACFFEGSARLASRVGSPPALPPSGTSGRPATLPAPRASRAPSPAAHPRGRDGEAEREGASVASGCGGEGAGPEVPEGGSERGGCGGWGAEGRSEPSQGSHEVPPALTTDQLVVEIAALASVLRLAVRVPDVNALLARSNGSDLGAAVGGLPGAPAYALFTLTAACSQSKQPDSSARVLVLDCPAPSDELRTFWLELVRRHLPEQMPSFFWTRESGRLLVALGPPPSLMLAYLADPEHQGSRRWSLRTLDPSARLNALEKLSPGQRRVLAAGDAPLADVLQAFA